VTNSGTVTIGTGGTLNGDVAGSTWVNNDNSTLNYQSNGTAAPMATGTLTATATGNTVNYSRAGNQNVKGTNILQLKF
jgi:hypothetical protein